MPALPPPTDVADDRLLVVATNDIEAIVTAACIARYAPAAVTRIFLDSPELGALAAIPAYRQGTMRTVVLDFPTPELARNPEGARSVLRIALELTWVSRHPLAPDELEDLTRVTAASPAALWPAAAQLLSLPEETPELFEEILVAPPLELPDPDAATPGLRWRCALEATRLEPLHLGPRTRGLIDLEPADPELMETGFELLTERRALATTSSFHSFPLATGETGVIVVAPSWASGYYLDMAHDLRRARDHLVSILAFDSQEPVIIEYSEHRPPPVDLEARRALLRSAFPDHLVQPWRAHGVIIKGPATSDLAILDKIIEIIRQALH